MRLFQFSYVTSDVFPSAGWWLCALRGRQGIAPGNRLRLMPYMYDPTGLGFATGLVAGSVGHNAQQVRSLMVNALAIELCVLLLQVGFLYPNPI